MWKALWLLRWSPMVIWATPVLGRAWGRLPLTVRLGAARKGEPSRCKRVNMSAYSPASQSFTRLVLTSFAQRLITIQYEISGLARIFHTDSAAACEHLMDAASASNYSSGTMKHTARRQNARLPDPISLRSLLVTISMKYSGWSLLFLCALMKSSWGCYHSF